MQLFNLDIQWEPLQHYIQVQVFGKKSIRDRTFIKKKKISGAILHEFMQLFNLDIQWEPLQHYIQVQVLEGRVLTLAYSQCYSQFNELMFLSSPSIMHSNLMN
jgi:hypothetical protein